MTDLTDRQRLHVAEAFRRMKDRLSRAEVAKHADAFDMLGRIIEEAKNLRKTLVKAKKEDVK